MARYKHYDYNQLMMVPVSLEKQLMPGTLEYAINHVVEERLDLTFFDERYCNDETGRKAIDPKVLIKIVLFGYSRGLLSSRSLERACRENITFMALACGQTPDHSTIAAFVSSFEMKQKIDTPEGCRTYSKRLGIVEPVFGNIRTCKKMDRFTLRGKIKVNIQWRLYCLVHNIEKIMNFGKNYAMSTAQ